MHDSWGCRRGMWIGCELSRMAARMTRVLPVVFKGRWVVLLLTAVTAFAATPLTAAEPRGPAYILSKRAIAAPAGFSGMCGKYDWVCASSSVSFVSRAAGYDTADVINRSVNRKTRQISDQAQYRRDEFWALPTKRGGDCEDLVLLKKMLLVKAGFPANALLIATVLDLRGGRHAVLVLRTDAGDYVLDSLDNRIRHWIDTGYTFLKMQNPSRPSNWDAIFAGGRLATAETVVAMK